MVDFTIYSEKNFLQVLKSNDKYKKAIATKTIWQDVVFVIDSLNVKYTQNQINYVKSKEWKL